MKFYLVAAGAFLLHLVGAGLLVFLLFAGVRVLQDNGGLKTVVESVWCGSEGCDSR